MFHCMLMIPFTDYALYIWIQKKPSTLNALKVNWGGGYFRVDYYM